MADVLYGALGGSATTSDLYSIDPLTAVGTTIGPIGYAVTGMAVDPTDDTLYGVTSVNSAVDPLALITIDKATGAGTLVGSLGVLQPVPDIAFDSFGQLWGWFEGVDDLGAIDKTNGSNVSAGDSGLVTFGDGMDFDGSDVLYACLRGTGRPLYTVDQNTGGATAGPTISGGGFSTGTSIAAASFTRDKTVFYAVVIDSGAATLVTIDIGTGAITVIAASFASPPLDAIAWGPPAVPPLPPIPPAVLGARVSADLLWRTLITTIGSRTLACFDRRATNRQLLFTLNQPAYATGQVASDDPEVNLAFPDADSPAILTNNRRLIYMLRRELNEVPPYVCRFGGIVMSIEDDGADAPTSRYTAYDPWQYMMNRPFRDPDTLDLPGPNGYTYNAGTLASDIAKEQLALTDSLDGETHIKFAGFPFVFDSDPLGDPITFDAGISVGEVWTQLCDTGTLDIYLKPLYDPIGSPGKVCEFHAAPAWGPPLPASSERIGQVRHDIIMGWDIAGNALAGINRNVDGTRLLNKANFYAGQGGYALGVESDAASIAAYGEYWAQQFFPEANNRGPLVDLLALAEVAIRRNGARSVSLDPAPERTELVLRDYGLGDYLPIWASRNLREPLFIDYDGFDPDFPGASGHHRCFAIPIDIDDNGVARVNGILTASETAGGTV